MPLLIPDREPSIGRKLHDHDADPSALTGARPDQTQADQTQGRAFPLGWRGGLLCVLLVALCILAIWPVAEVGVQDDWVYTLTAFDFARTGHFIFHGWAAPIEGWQAIWGALFAKLFGATFTAVRLSTLPVALLTVFLYHAILRRFGLNAAHAIFGTLVFALSPLFLPLSATFMTDVPAFFAVVVCLYLCQCAIKARSDLAAAFFLVMAALANVGLGTARQTAWLAALVMVPSCAWILRRRRHMLAVGAIALLASLVCIFLITAWFGRQPFAAPERWIPGRINVGSPGQASVWLLRAGVTILLFLLPALTLGVRPISPLRRWIAAVIWPLRWWIVAVAAAALPLLIVLHRGGQAHLITFPWLGVLFGERGILQDGLFGSNPPIPFIFRAVLFLAVVISLLASIETFKACRHASATPRALPLSELTSWRVIAILLLPYAAINCLFLIPNAFLYRVYDRYLLEIAPILLIVCLRWHQDHVSARIPFLPKVVVLLIAVLTVADTHDLFSTYRAQVRVVKKLEAAGIPRTEIRGGLAFDMATQVYVSGYINDPRVINPPGAYKPEFDRAALTATGCNYYSLQHFLPDVHARYEIAAFPSTCLEPTNFQPESFSAWLPPFHRKLFVGRLLTTGEQPPSSQ